MLIDPDDFAHFVEDYYPDRLAELLAGYPRDVRSLRIEWVDLSSVFPDIADDYRTAPNYMSWELDRAFQQYPSPTGDPLDEVRVRVGGLPDGDHRRVSDITSSDAGGVLAVRADLARLSEPDWRYTRTEFMCVGCTEPNPSLAIEQPRGRSIEPRQAECDMCGKRTWTVDGASSEAVDYRIARLKDPPGVSGGTSQPGISAYVEGIDLLSIGGEYGLADHSGESVVMYGQYVADEDTALMYKGEPSPSRFFVVEAIDFESGIDLSEEVMEHREEFEELAARGDAYELVRDSIAPSLLGDDDLDLVRDGAWMYLFGCPRVETDSVTRRGDIHMFMVGDPATGKSTIMEDVAELSPRSEIVSGNTVTGAGLTAAADHDENIGWYLEPGVLPRANGGHAIVDELDKAAGDATGQLHSALEGAQRINVAKATVRASLNTRCGLMAGANPSEGRFDRFERIHEQIDIDPALLSRFDLIFTLMDEVDSERDAAVGQSSVEPPEEFHRPIDADVLRAWIAYARENVHPIEFTDEAKEKVAEVFVEARTINDSLGGDGAVVSATKRWPHDTRRLASASARLQLRETVTVGDVERAAAVQRRKLTDTSFDPERGEFNANRADEAAAKSGTDATPVRSQRERYRVLCEIIRDGESDDGEGLSAEEVTADATRRGIDESVVADDLARLQSVGAISMPSNDRYRFVGFP